MDQQLAEVRRMHAERAARQKREQESGDAEMTDEKTVKKGKVIGGKYFANPPGQMTMRELGEIINRYQRVHRQKKSEVVDKIEVDSDTAMFFQSFLRQRDFSVQRMAYMYGTVEGTTVRCHCCYEPEQESRATSYTPLEDDRLAKVDGIAALMGLRRVGVLVSAPPATPSDPVLTAAEVLLTAQQQAEHGAHCCLIQVRLSEDRSEVKVEAYQASSQCVDIYKEGTLSPHPTDPKLVMSERELEAVKEIDRDSAGHKAMVVSKSATHEVDSVWFTVPVPIGGFESDVVGNRFIRLNRPGEVPPTWENVKIFLKDPKRSGKSFAEAVRDFHLIVFLSGWFDIKREMPGFVAAMVSRNPSDMAGYEHTIKAYAGMI
eukprot:TRINITY_DN7648_c0_g1_i1.p1 TRINITY_DN7648_c0_g1~~TRINITY_DN7648_c0_g1_i1.p1  ORF type:complete len:374 (+),score=96.11 TRINITY_DN7648_c0_g1_i1:538-1659(+)